MADEQKDKAPLTDQETGEAVRPTPEYTPGESKKLPDPESPLEDAVDQAFEASEAATETPVVKAFDDAVTSVVEAVSELEPENDPGITDFRRPMLESVGTHSPVAQAAASAAAHHDAHAAMLSDTTTIMGRTITVPGGIYTVVFGFLAAATIIEIIIGSLPSGLLLIPLLLAFATIKAALVVAYYMHLNVDSRLFLYILLVPLVLALLAALFLMAVPPTGY